MWRLGAGQFHAQDLSIVEKVKRFRRGYDAMKQLDHPQIVKVHAYTDCPIGFYMDLIDGPNLRNYIGGPLDPSEMLQLLLVVGETLRHAHGRKVVHRDVKPENIIMAYDEGKQSWKPHLTDFDLAWFSTATQFTKDAIGATNYAAPEQLATPMSAAAHAATVDVFSFGQVMYFVATRGSDPVPYGFADNVRALERTLGAGWSLDSAQEFVALYEECTQHRPEHRMQDFPTVCDRLFRISQIFKKVGPRTEIEVDNFLREIVFSIVGLAGGASSDNSFQSLSGKTQVIISIRRETRHGVDLRYEFLALDQPVVAGVTRFEQVRKLLYERIDDAISSGKFDARRKFGTEMPFQAYLEHDNVPLTFDGVAHVRSLISAVIDAVEGK